MTLWAKIQKGLRKAEPRHSTPFLLQVSVVLVVLFNWRGVFQGIRDANPLAVLIGLVLVLVVVGTWQLKRWALLGTWLYAVVAFARVWLHRDQFSETFPVTFIACVSGMIVLPGLLYWRRFSWV